MSRIHWPVMTGFRSIILTTFLSTLLVVSSALALDTIPSRPIQNFSDGAKTLRLAFAKSLERILLEHESLTGESLIVLTIEKSPHDEKLTEYATRVFNEWKDSTTKPSSALVLVFDVEGGNLAWRAGVGMDPVLAEKGADQVQIQIAGPEFKKGRPDRAVLLSTRKMLELIGSPVYVNGKVDSELRDAGFMETFVPESVLEKNQRWWAWILFGAIFFMLVGYRILAVEVHYTSEGWQRIPPWENFIRYLRMKFRKSRTLVSGGGVSGKY